MKRQWEPSDVRLATVNGERMLVLRGRGIFEGNWYTQGPVAGSRLSVQDSWLLDDRPLVVIDPEDREQVARLIRLFDAEVDGQVRSVEVMASDIHDMQAALREFANPTPPKPDEPMGLGAVVEDEDGSLLVRVPNNYEKPWSCGGATRWSWSDINVVRVLSEGVTP